MKMVLFRLFTLLILSFSTWSFTQDFERIAPKEIPHDAEAGRVIPPPIEKREEEGSTLITPKLTGLLLVSSPDDIQQEGRTDVEGVQFFHLDVPGHPEILQDELTHQAIGKPLTIDDLSKIKSTISTYYRNNNRPVVTVLALEQKVHHGTLQLVVLESHVGDVSFSGNYWFRTNLLKKYTNYKKGDPIDSVQLSRDLKFMNRNPFRLTNAVLRPGQEVGTTDIEFKTKDRFPFRFYVGGDNTGIDSTGSGRLFVGFNWGDALLQDQQLSYQFTKSTDFGRFFVHTADWKIPFPWKHLLNFFGGYSKIHPKMPFQGMRNTGESYQISGRYIIPLPSSRFYLHEVAAGADYKRTNINLIFSDLTLIGNAAVIAQVALGYEGKYKRKPVTVDFEGYCFISPGDIFPNQNDSSYERLRPDAQSTYAYIRTRLVPLIDVFYGTLAIDTRLQLASSNLLSSEQFGLGGFSTVRGYDERDLNTDNAFMLSVEWRTPSFQLFHPHKFKRLTDDLKLHLFVDYGVGWNHKRTAPEINTYLLSVGPGLRYVISPYLTCRFDWGIKLHKLPSILRDTSFSKVHFSVIGSF
ncbi:ShlB/FhaC/HecB family hemolysin secretion/activation protein [Simkania sp.]|uniref:ShlB/FhaC/HecB family hemolysin secretion/activation protein n=1 Tax=Simkania sp. TaxID=34094 RepID=UPI003B5168FD